MGAGASNVGRGHAHGRGCVHCGARVHPYLGAGASRLMSLSCAVLLPMPREVFGWPRNPSYTTPNKAKHSHMFQRPNTRFQDIFKGSMDLK